MTKNAKLTLLVHHFYKSKGLNLNWHQVEVIQRAASNAQKYAEYYCNGVLFTDHVIKR